jgi:hypothetical protein
MTAELSVPETRREGHARGDVTSFTVVSTDVTSRETTIPVIRRAIFLMLAVASLLIAITPAAALGARAGDSQFGQTRPGTSVVLRASHQAYESRSSATRESALQRHAIVMGGAPTSDIQVAYTGFSPAAQTVFEAAVNVWEHILVSSQVIHVNATWSALPSGVLGSAGPTRIAVQLRALERPRDPGELQQLIRRLVPRHRRQHAVHEVGFLHRRAA